MPVDPIGFWDSVSSGSATTQRDQELGKDDFLMLLLAQLKHQDPLSPLDNQEFIAQLAQFNTLEEMINLNQQFGDMLQFQELSYASTLIGKTVTAIVNDPVYGEMIVQGTVAEVIKGEDGVSLIINGYTPEGELIVCTAAYDDIITIGGPVEEG